MQFGRRYGAFSGPNLVDYWEDGVPRAEAFVLI